jgi:diguanylate cyclase (GGDEF)-like protein
MTADDQTFFFDGETVRRELAEAYRSVALLSHALEKEKRKVAQLSFNDPLTGLYNRAFFLHRLTYQIDIAWREGWSVPVLLLNLSNFKAINENYGHETGDLVLQRVAQRMSGALRTSDTLARLGNDEFTVILPTSKNELNVVSVALKLLDAVREPLQLGDRTLILQPNIGIALFPRHAKDPNALLQHADQAARAAKNLGCGYYLFQADVEGAPAESIDLASEFPLAIADGQLDLYYQPKLDLKTGRICGAEALIRWQHPTRGLVMPGDFIAAVEQTTMVKELTHYVIERAARQRNDLAGAEMVPDETGAPDFHVAINLSPRALYDANLPDHVIGCLKRWNLPPEQLVIEITESALMIDEEGAAKVLTSLASLGIGISIDDFGTGYSSFGRLRSLPVGEIKIDRSFVRNMHKRRHDLAIVRSIIELGKNLDIKVTAEGVEDKEVFALLAELGCDQVQGYGVARPMPSAYFRAWLAHDISHRQKMLALSPERPFHAAHPVFDFAPVFAPDLAATARVSQPQ